MAVHTLHPTQATLKGTFSRDHAPILTIDPGDTVQFRVPDAGWSFEPMVHPALPRVRIAAPPGEDENGHAVLGPIAIRGAQPGMTLAIEIGYIRPGSYGYTLVGGWDHSVNRRLGLLNSGTVHQWVLDADTMTGRNQHGHTVALRPFMGIMGLSPAEPGYHATPPPRACGGNLDCKALTAGSTLYLPIEVEGAWFYTGDGHAAQGDGEVSVTAIECPIEQVDLTFHLLDDMPLTLPQANTPIGWVAFGLHEDLNEAVFLALENMLSLMQRLHGLTRPDALGLASIVVDLHITQIVNGVCGVHAVLPHGAIR